MQAFFLFMPSPLLYIVESWLQEKTFIKVAFLKIGTMLV